MSIFHIALLAGLGYLLFGREKTTSMQPGVTTQGGPTITMHGGRSLSPSEDIADLREQIMKGIGLMDMYASQQDWVKLLETKEKVEKLYAEYVSKYGEHPTRFGLK